MSRISQINSTRNASRIRRKVRNGSVIIGTECLNSPYVPSSYPAMCMTQHESETKKTLVTLNKIQ